MALAPNKTKLVCTIGPASESPEILRQMLHAGMNIARLKWNAPPDVILERTRVWKSSICGVAALAMKRPRCLDI